MQHKILIISLAFVHCFSFGVRGKKENKSNRSNTHIQKKIHKQQMLAGYLFHAAIKNRVKPIQRYPKKSKELSSVVTGRTLLHIAAKSGSSQVAKSLLDRGINPNKQDTDGKTPLHLAAREYNICMMQLLLASGANPYQKDKNSRNALMIGGHHWKVRNTLLKHCVKQSKDSNNTACICPICLTQKPWQQQTFTSTKCLHTICTPCKKNMWKNRLSKCPHCNENMSL